MSLRLWRKTKRFNHPGSLSYKKINAWHTRSLTPKTKKFFSKNQKLYSAEIRSSVFISSICQKNATGLFDTNARFKGRFLNDSTINSDFSFTQKAYNWDFWRTLSLQLNPFIWRSLFYSGFWVFNYPMAVPGAVKIRRSKNLFTLQKNAMHNLNDFMHRLSSYWLKQLYKQNILMHKGGTSQTFIKNLERFWPTIVFKMGLTPTMINAKKMISHQFLTVNGQKHTKAKLNAMPADRFCVIWQMLAINRFQSFHNKIFKHLKSSKIFEFLIVQPKDSKHHT